MMPGQQASQRHERQQSVAARSIWEALYNSDDKFREYRYYQKIGSLFVGFFSKKEKG